MEGITMNTNATPDPVDEPTPTIDEIEKAHLDAPRGGLGMANWGDVTKAYNSARTLERRAIRAEKERDAFHKEVFDWAESSDLYSKKVLALQSQLREAQEALRDLRMMLPPSVRGVELTDLPWKLRNEKLLKADALLSTQPDKETTKCPKCGSAEIAKRHRLGDGYLPETDWMQCESCDHQFNQQ